MWVVEIDVNDANSDFFGRHVLMFVSTFVSEHKENLLSLWARKSYLYTQSVAKAR